MENKITVDLDKEVIILHKKVLLAELYQYLNLNYPENKWMEFSLELDKCYNDKPKSLTDFNNPGVVYCDSKSSDDFVEGYKKWKDKTE